jgi:putative membrane protein
MILAVDVSFWCSTVAAPFTWTPRLYPGIWAAIAVLVVPYLVAQRRRSRSGAPNGDRRQRTVRYLAGALVVWLATDWPIGLLGASYLASAHMLQYLLYGLVAAPLLLLGTPEWMARRFLSRIHGYQMALRLSRPLVAGIVYNVVLIVTHAPATTDLLRANQLGSAAMDVAWLLAGLVLWLPICSPLPEHTRRGYGAKMAYLFIAATIVPVFPASFLTFSEFPLYEIYELAPRVFGLEAGTDQAMAGLIMKVGSIPVIWGTLLVMMMRWARDEGVPGLEATRPSPERA